MTDSSRRPSAAVSCGRSAARPRFRANKLSSRGVRNTAEDSTRAVARTRPNGLGSGSPRVSVHPCFRGCPKTSSGWARRPPGRSTSFGAGSRRTLTIATPSRSEINRRCCCVTVTLVVIVGHPNGDDPTPEAGSRADHPRPTLPPEPDHRAPSRTRSPAPQPLSGTCHGAARWSPAQLHGSKTAQAPGSTPSRGRGDHRRRNRPPACTCPASPPGARATPARRPTRHRRAGRGRGHAAPGTSRQRGRRCSRRSS